MMLIGYLCDLRAVIELSWLCLRDMSVRLGVRV